MTELADLKTSVKRDDYSTVTERGGVVYIQSYAPWLGYGDTGLPPDLPPWWSTGRDQVLRNTVRIADSMWASAVSKAISKIAARGWKIEDTDKSSRRMERLQDLLLHADGRDGWVQFVSKHLRDYITTDNGAFIEIERATRGAGSRISCLRHLDSMRCTRTGDPEIPVIYRDRKGVEHAMRYWQVLDFVDMPDPSETYFGVGLCATSRAYQTIYKMAAIERFIAERVSGKRPLSLYFVNGISQQQIIDAYQTAMEESNARGQQSYMGALIIPSLLKDKAPDIAEVPFASIPAPVNIDEERRDAYLRYANALGVAVQDIQPLSGQGLGTGTQTLVLAEAAEGQGLASWAKQWEHKVNFDIAPTATTFAFSTNDTRDQQAKADLALARANERKTRIEAGEINPQEARQIAADAGDLPEEMLQAPDQTPDSSLRDTEKPTDEQSIIAPLSAPQQPAQQATAAFQAVPS